jgi:hypothetical protein
VEKVSYAISISFNGRLFTELIIGQYYKKNHPEMNDELILKLIIQLDNLVAHPADLKDDFLYFKEEPIFLENKPYRLIFVIEKNGKYLGVINAFRIQEKKYGISIR